MGSTGLEVSQLCLGTWRFGKETGGVIETDEKEAHELLNAAKEIGINFIDSADEYGTPRGRSEKIIGDWLNNQEREDFVLASKVYFPFKDKPNRGGLSRKHIRAQIEGSLNRLGTDFLDIYYIHRWDDNTPIEETLYTLNELVEKGLVHYLGASKMAAWQLIKALWKSDTNGLEAIKVAQPLFHASYRDEILDYLEVCADQDLAVCPYSPLAGGFLTGKYRRSEKPPEDSRASIDDSFENRYISEKGWQILDEIRSIANTLNATPAQVSLRWLIQQKRFTTVPIIGVRTTDQLKQNIKATEITLTDEQYKQITQARYKKEERVK